MTLTFILVPLIGALIGWFTNFIAVKMLFHPREKKKILFVEVQGIFPKRQEAIAERLGNIVADELLSIEDIKSKINNKKNLDEIESLVDKKLDDFLEEDFPREYPIMSLLMGESTKTKVKNSVLVKVSTMAPEMINKYLDNLEKSLDIKAIVKEKVSNFSAEKLEDMLNQVLSKEFGFIERVGAFLGFTIGLVQVLIIYFTSA